MKFPGLILWPLLVVWLDATALDATTGVRVTPLAKETSSWDGKPIVYPAGTAEMTALLVEIAPGAQTGWHCHLVPNFAYMLEGKLELALDDGRVKLLNAGDALSEVVNRSHNGRNIGSAPVKLVVFYAGATGTPLSVDEKECLPEKMKTGGLDYKSLGATCQPWLTWPPQQTHNFNDQGYPTSRGRFRT